MIFVRKCIRCGADMVDGLIDFYGGISFPKTLTGGFEGKAAICPKCHEVSYYMEDETFDRMKNCAARIQAKQEKRKAKK